MNVFSARILDLIDYKRTAEEYKLEYKQLTNIILTYIIITNYIT